MKGQVIGTAYSINKTYSIVIYNYYYKQYFISLFGRTYWQLFTLSFH